MSSDVEGGAEQTSVLEAEVAEITCSAEEEEEVKVSGLEMMVTIMETITETTIMAEQMTGHGIITTGRIALSSHFIFHLAYCAGSTHPFTE